MSSSSQRVKLRGYYKGGFGEGAWGAEAPPPKFYYVLARKIVEATVQVQLHLKQLKDGNSEKRSANFLQEKTFQW